MSVRSVPSRRPKPLLHLLAAIGPVILCAVLANLATIPNLGWYETLAKPSFSPPNWLFGPAWAMLYGLMAFAFYRVLRQPDYLPDRPAAIHAFLAQILLNASWSWAFFGAQNAGFGLVVIAALLIAVLVTILRFLAVDRVAGWCLMPYLFWLGFAGLLNLSIFILNRA